MDSSTSSGSRFVQSSNRCFPGTSGEHFSFLGIGRAVVHRPVTFNSEYIFRRIIWIHSGQVNPVSRHPHLCSDFVSQTSQLLIHLLFERGVEVQFFLLYVSVYIFIDSWTTAVICSGWAPATALTYFKYDFNSFGPNSRRTGDIELLRLNARNNDDFFLRTGDRHIQPVLAAFLVQHAKPVVHPAFFIFRIANEKRMISLSSPWTFSMFFTNTSSPKSLDIIFPCLLFNQIQDFRLLLGVKGDNPDNFVRPLLQKSLQY
jgi:hypothetical protein